MTTQWQWWRYRRRVVSRGLLASRRTHVYLAASYLIRRLSTTLLGVRHHRVAALYVFKLAYGQRAARSELRFSSRPSASRLSRFSLSLSPFLALYFSSVYSTPIRYFLLARAFIALVLVIRRKGKWAKDSRATLLRVLEKSKPLRALASNPSLSFPRPIRITSRRAWGCFSHGDCRKKRATRRDGEAMRSAMEK